MKTGPEIALFNLPRITTCPGKSKLCVKHCYVRPSQRFPVVNRLHEERFKASKKDDFVDRMVDDIIKSKTRVVRIHTSGDFYSAKYIDDWVKIINRTPNVVYYAYTRSWRCDDMIKQLDRLRRLPNMQLWWFSDQETGSPPEGRVAYMAIDDDDAPKFDASLIFRVKRKTEKLMIGGVSVCPLDNGKPELRARGMTCSNCRVCFSLALEFMAGP